MAVSWRVQEEPNVACLEKRQKDSRQTALGHSNRPKFPRLPSTTKGASSCSPPPSLRPPSQQRRCQRTRSHHTVLAITPTPPISAASHNGHKHHIQPYPPPTLYKNPLLYPPPHYHSPPAPSNSRARRDPSASYVRTRRKSPFDDHAGQNQAFSLPCACASKAALSSFRRVEDVGGQILGTSAAIGEGKLGAVYRGARVGVWSSGSL